MDEQSMMTYLSQYPNAKLKQGAPLRPRTNPNSKRDQQPGKSIVEYVAVLREMANCCNFGTFTNRMLRDSLVQGVEDGTVQREMLSKNEHCLTKAGGVRVGLHRIMTHSGKAHAVED
nr:unnamed protein product [Timema bartmani]